eukprot:g36288.t1
MGACLSGVHQWPLVRWCMSMWETVVDHDTPIAEATLDSWQFKTGVAAGPVKQGGKFLQIGLDSAAPLRWVIRKEAELGFALRGIEGVDSSEQSIIQARSALGLLMETKHRAGASRGGPQKKKQKSPLRTGLLQNTNPGPLAEPMIAMTGHSEDGARVRLVHCSLEHLAHIPSGDVSAVFHMNAMYFWDDVAGVLAEILRVLEPGGEHMTVTRMQDALMKRDSAQPGFTRTEKRYLNTDLGKYRAQLQRAGFEVVSVEIVPGVYEGLMTHERVLARKPMSHDRGIILLLAGVLFRVPERIANRLDELEDYRSGQKIIMIQRKLLLFPMATEYTKKTVISSDLSLSLGMMLR